MSKISLLSRWKTQFSNRFLRHELSRVIHEFQLKWKTYLLLYYAIPSVHRFRSQEKGERFILSPHLQNFISIFLFFCVCVWHICISLFWLIRICWLKVNEINSSWWHWIRLLLLFEFSGARRTHWLCDVVVFAHLRQHKCSIPPLLFLLPYCN